MTDLSFSDELPRQFQPYGKSILGTNDNPFRTNFSLVENPMYQRHIWMLGKTDGRDWNDPKTTGFSCVDSVNASGFDDGIAHIKPTYKAFNANQWAEGIVYKAAGYSPASAHEIELLLRSTIALGNTIQYEFIFGTNPANASYYVSFVRWNGVNGDFTTINAFGTGLISHIADGDLFRVELTGNNATAYQNGTVIVNNYDLTNTGAVPTIASGQPGVGFWPSGTSVPANLGWKYFGAGNM